jgi:hypothetical protein
VKKIDFKSKTVTVLDHGMYPHVAIKLAESFGRVNYHTNWECAFPTCEPLLVGDGFPGVSRTKKFWKEAADADLFVVTDIYWGDLVHELVRQGKRVWAPRDGEDLEIKRWQTNQLLPQIGLPQPKANLVTGIPNLRKFLMEHEDCFVKVSCLRGMMETKHHTNYDLSEYWLDSLEKQLSGVKNIIKFVVFDAIKNAVEVGSDMWSVDGKYPSIASWGVEIKDCCLVSKVEPYAEFPPGLKRVMDAFAPVLQDYQYRGMCCAEVRENEEGPFMIDWASRCGSPSSEALMEVFSNWAEIFWHGAEGKLVEPEKLADYSVEVIIQSPSADPEEWQTIQIQDDVRKWVKLHLWARVEGRDIIAPNEFPLKEFGAVVGVGDSIEEAIKNAEKHCEGVKGDGIEFKTDKIQEGLKEIAEGKSLGIDFGVDLQKVEV